MTTGAEPTQSTSSNGRLFWIGVSVLIIAMLTLGWYFATQKHIRPAAAGAKRLAVCKPIPEGMAYVGGKLVPASSVQQKASTARSCQSAPLQKADAKGDWTRPIEAGFAPLGLDWMSLSLNRSEDGAESVSVSGTAVSRTDRTYGFDVARRAIASADDGAHVGVALSNDIKIARGKASWADDMEASLRGLGFDWLDFTVRGPVATVSGVAPSDDDKAEAFKLSQAALVRNAQASAQVRQLINGIVTVSDGTGSAADALVDLSNSDTEELTVEACNAAFSKTMQGRNIQFEIGSAAISSDSAQLLDALSGIALLCVNTNGHNVEIGGHTDTTGDPALNLTLSESRAKSVQSYLVGLGVNSDQLEAIGYGTTQLLDTADTAEAHAKNRRTEFKVTAAE